MFLPWTNLVVYSRKFPYDREPYVHFKGLSHRVEPGSGTLYLENSGTMQYSLQGVEDL